MANLSNINNILRTGSLGVGINRDPASPFEVSSATKPGIKMFNTATSGKTYQAYSDVNGNYIIYDEDADSNRLIISGSGNATFAGKILVGVGTTAAASINAFSTTVSTGLHSALRIISQPSASNYWDIGATNGASTILNFYHNGSTTPKISFTHLGGATFAGQVGVAGKTPAYGLTLAQGTGVNNKIAWTDGTPSFRASIYANSSNDKFTIATGNASSVETTALEIDTSQNATFAGNSITVDPASGDAILQLQSSTQTLRVDQNSIRTTTNTNLSFLTNSTLALTLDTSQNATFAGSVDVGTFTLAGSGIVADAGMTLQIGGGSVNALTLADSSGNATFAGTVETTTLRTDVVNNKANSANIIYRSGTSTLVGGGTSANKLYVLDDGSIGIGTTSPGRKLTITGNVSGDANNLLLSNENDTNGDSASIGFSMLSNNTYVKSGIFFERTTTQGRGSLHLAVNNEVNGNNVTKSDAKLTINNAGNVGIGTTSPSSKLHVTDAPANGVYLSYLYNSGTHNSSHGLNVQTAANNIATYGLRVNTGGDSNALAVMGNGNVGIGTASPSAKLEIVTAVGADAIRMNYGQSADIFLGFASANPRILLQDNSNVVTHNFQSNGDNYIVGSNVAIGTTVPDQTGYGYKTLTIMGGTNAGDSGVIELLAPNVDADDQNYGIVSFGAGGTRTAMISANRKAANNAANLRFWTAPGGAGIQERMRIDKDGQVMIRRTADYSTDKYLLQVGDASLDDCIPAVFTVASTSARNQIVFSNFNNNLVGTIITSGSATSYNTSSDYRLKEDLKDFAGLEKISNIKVYDFKWKDNDNYDEHSKRGYGVLAHELQEVLPNAVSGEKDAEEMQGVDYSKIVPLLVKSIQELEARVKELENN